METVKYEVIRESIKTGDRFEFAGKTIIGKIIRFFTKEPVNHTALAMSIDQYSDYAGNRKFLLEAEEDGIVLNTVSRTLAEFNGRVFYTPLLSEHDDKRKDVGDWALQQVCVKYDFGSLFRNAFGTVNADMRKLFCSEYFFSALVAGRVIPGFKMAGGKITDLNGRLVSAPRPGELDRYPVFGRTIEIVK